MLKDLNNGKYIKLHVEMIPDSNNKAQGRNGKKAAFAFSAQKRMWNDMIWIIRKNKKNRGELEGWQLPLKRATVILFYHFKSKGRRDPDNYSGKVIHDALCTAGFLHDDSFTNIDILPIADFGNKKDNMDIYILEGQQLSGDVKNILG